MGSKADGPSVLKYKLGMHMVLCHGPVDSIKKIVVADREAWSGTETGGTISIDEPELFGGLEREGGIEGDVDIDMGESTQTPNAYLDNIFSNLTPAVLVPGFRGVVSAILNRVYIGLNPYLKPWKFQAVRTLTGHDGSTAWYSSKADISGAMNPAHMYRECIIADWGMRHPSSSIDEASFMAVADTLYTEGFGLCMQWLRAEPIEAFMQRILDHIGATRYIDPVTGLWCLKLIRSDYVLVSLPLLDDSNVIAVEEFERRGWGETVNEVVVTYTDMVDGEDKSVPLQNNANITTQGRKITEQVSYPGIPTADLAARVCLRDLNIKSAPFARATLIVNRDAYDLVPGDAVKWTSPEHEISETPFRVTNINTGNLTNGQIRLDIVEDFFDLPAETWWEPQETEWESPNNEGGETGSIPAATLTGQEMPYYEIATTTDQADLDALGADYGFLLVTGGEQPYSIYFQDQHQLMTATTSADNTLVHRGGFAHTPFVTITGALDQEVQSVEAYTNTGAFGTLVDDSGDNYYFNVQHPNAYKPSWAILSGSGGLELVELVSVAGGYMTMNRGILDTVPLAHNAGATLLMADDWPISDKIEYTDGQNVYAKLRTKTGVVVEPIADASLLTVTMDNRAQRPYAPGNLKFNGSAYPASITGDMTITWAHRDRLQQTVPNTFYDQSYGNIGPEAGVTYNLTVYNNTQALSVLSATGLTGTSQVVTKAGSPGWNTGDSLTITLESERSSLVSHMQHSVTLIGN